MVRPIEHSGVVERTAPDAVYVRITSRSACGACRARQACGLAETQEKIVAVKTADAPHYAAGEQVVVGVRRSAGMRAVALAYVGALAVLLAVLFAANAALGWSEGRARSQRSAAWGSTTSYCGSAGGESNTQFILQ